MPINFLLAFLFVCNLCFPSRSSPQKCTFACFPYSYIIVLIPHVCSVCTNPCSMPLIHGTVSYFRHGYWRNRIKTKLQYHSYAITFCLRFTLDTEWTKVTVRGFSLKSQGCGSMSWVKLPLFSLCPLPGHSLSGATASL